MKLIIKIAAAALVLGTTATSAMAEGFYGALDLGQSKPKDMCTSLPAGVTGCKDTATLFRVAGGTQFTPMWGAEVSYGSYGKASAGTVNAPGFAFTTDWQLSGIQFSATGTFPLGDAFALTGKAGVARTDLKFTAQGSVNGSISASSTKLAWGVGAQYSLTKNLAVRAQYEDLGVVGDVNSGTYRVTLLSAGLIFGF